MSNGGVHYLFQKCANWHQPSHVETGQFWHCASLRLDGHGHEANSFSLAAWLDGGIVITLFVYVLGFTREHFRPAPFLRPYGLIFLLFLAHLICEHQHIKPFTSNLLFMINIDLERLWWKNTCISLYVHKHPVIQYPRHPPPPLFFPCTCYRWMETRLNLQILCNAQCKLYLNVEFLFLFWRLFNPALWRPQTYGIQCLAWCHISTSVF